MNKSKIGLAIAATFLVLQLIPLSRSNPPELAQPAMPAEVAEVLKRACYDCHSNQTQWPWYAWVAPISWLVVYDVHEGREHLNFSEWSKLDAAKQTHAFEEIVEVVEKGEMPPAIYTPLHPQAKLSERDKQALIAWAKSNGG